MKRFVITILNILICIISIGQNQNRQWSSDSSAIQNVSRLKAYKDVIPKSAISQKGIFCIHQVDDNYFLEIGDSMIGKDILIVTRIASGGIVSNNLSGDEINNQVVRFEKGSGNRVFLRKSLFDTYTGDSSASLFQAVTRSNFAPIIASFRIEALSPVHNGCVVNITNFLLEDNDLFAFSDQRKAENRITVLDKEKSYISKLQVFPLNMEVISIKTYTRTVPTSVVGGPMANSLVSFELNTSLVMLPEHPMQQRFSDARIGYFSVRQFDYETDPQGVKARSYIKRWRLEPKSTDQEKYEQGQLVEPSKPIIFYVDPATPKKWVPYIIKGINDWQVAFEQAGFKNAIRGEEAPSLKEQPNWSINDARHSVVVYKPSVIKNASGPSIADPRTGEILESHINFYHNVQRLIHDWYMVQCATVDPKARKMTFDDSLMGELIRRVICHEVGHALGLTHNMGASSTVPVEKLREKKWVEANGISPSIMDYARFNYVAQPEDSISEIGLMMKIGAYDKWAINWGYRYFSTFKSPEAEISYMNALIIEKTKDKRYWFGAENTFNDPRVKREDLGDNSVLASKYGISNLKRIVPKLIEWTKVPNESYTNLNDIYLQVLSQYTTYLTHVTRNIGGIYENLKDVEELGPVYSPFPIERQKEAFRFLNEHLFQTPIWLIDTAILNRTGQTAIGVISEVQDKVLNALIYPPFNFLAMSSRNESTFGSKSTFTLLELLNLLKQTVWSELKMGNRIDIFRRSLQTKYITCMLQTYADCKNANMFFRLPISGVTNVASQDVASLLFGHLIDLQVTIRQKMALIKDEGTRYHLQFIEQKIESALKKNDNVR